MDPRIKKSYLDVKMYIARAEKRRVEAYLNYKWKTFCVPALREYEKKTKRSQLDEPFSKLKAYDRFKEACSSSFGQNTAILSSEYHAYEYEKHFVFTDWGEPKKTTVYGYAGFNVNIEKRPYADEPEHFEKLTSLKEEIQNFSISDFDDTSAYDEIIRGADVALSQRYGTQWRSNFFRYLNEKDIGLFLDESDQVDLEQYFISKTFEPNYRKLHRDKITKKWNNRWMIKLENKFESVRGPLEADPSDSEEDNDDAAVDPLEADPSDSGEDNDDAAVDPSSEADSADSEEDNDDVAVDPHSEADPSDSEEDNDDAMERVAEDDVDMASERSNIHDDAMEEQSQDGNTSYQAGAAGDTSDVDNNDEMDGDTNMDEEIEFEANGRSIREAARGRKGSVDDMSCDEEKGFALPVPENMVFATLEFYEDACDKYAAHLIQYLEDKFGSQSDDDNKQACIYFFTQSIPAPFEPLIRVETSKMIEAFDACLLKHQDAFVRSVTFPQRCIGMYNGLLVNSWENPKLLRQYMWPFQGTENPWLNFIQWYVGKQYDRMHDDSIQTDGGILKLKTRLYAIELIIPVAVPPPPEESQPYVHCTLLKDSSTASFKIYDKATVRWKNLDALKEWVNVIEMEESKMQPYNSLESHSGKAPLNGLEDVIFREHSDPIQHPVALFLQFFLGHSFDSNISKKRAVEPLAYFFQTGYIYGSNYTLFYDTSDHSFLLCAANELPERFFVHNRGLDETRLMDSLPYLSLLQCVCNAEL